jgi:hypothetical protein
MPTMPRASSRTPLMLSIAGLLLVPGAALAQSPDPASGAPGDPCVPGVVGKIDHPTGCTDIVLRMNVGGGFVPVEVSLTEAPTFTLYGDDTAIFRPQPPDGMFPMPGEPMTPLVRAVMTPEQVDALLAYALGPGGLADAQETYFNPLIADAPTTVFTVDAAGIQTQVAIGALGLDDPSAPDAAERAKFEALSDLLDSFEEQITAGNVESAALYEPDRYRGMLTAVWEGSTDPVVGWPWTDLTLEDFVAPEDNLARYAELTPDQVAAVTPVPSGGITNIRLSAPDGSEWYLSVRPLLPEESFLPAGVTV